MEFFHGLAKSLLKGLRRLLFFDTERVLKMQSMEPGKPTMDSDEPTMG